MNKYCIVANITVDADKMPNAKDELWNAARPYQVNNFSVLREDK